MRATECRSCHAAIVFVRTASGKLIPLDAEPNPAGNVEVLDPDGSPLAQVHKAPPLFLTGAGPFMPHHATCPDAARWSSR